MNGCGKVHIVFNSEKHFISDVILSVELIMIKNSIIEIL